MLFESRSKFAGPIRFEAFELDPRSGILRKHGVRIRFQEQPFRVLLALLERSGEVVTREELKDAIWSGAEFGDFDHSLSIAVNKIREALGDSAANPRYIETVPRRGYRFMAPLAEAPQAGPTLPHESEPITAGQALPDRNLPARSRFAVRPPAWCAGVVALAALAAALLYHGSANSARPSSIRSIAVLPLGNLSGDPNQEYLADGLTEELIGRLAGIHDLRVISRTSVTRFKGTTLSAPEIGKMLDVDALVEGSVIRQGGRVRIHAQLIRAARDAHFWSHTYDREVGDVLALESEVAQAIAEQVRVTVTAPEHTNLAAARPVSPEAYDSYLKGEFGPQNTRADLEENIAHFEDAIRKDATFAPAYLGLARRYYSLSSVFVGASPPAEMRPKALSAARKALELDPDLADAHVLVANIYKVRWQWRDAEAEYKRALQLKANDLNAQVGYADWLDCQGRTEEALAWARRARDLDPLGDATAGIAFILTNARRYDEAVEELRSVLAIHPDHAGARWSLGRALIAKGTPGPAIPELEKTASVMRRSPGALGMLATAYAAAGRRKEALRLLDEMKQRRQESYVPAGSFIQPYLALRDYDEAFSWFERSYAEQSSIMHYLKVHPLFDPVRGDARFKDLLRRVGLQ